MKPRLIADLPSYGPLLVKDVYIEGPGINKYIHIYYLHLFIIYIYIYNIYLKILLYIYIYIIYLYINIYIIYIYYIFIFIYYIYIFINKYTLLFACATTRCLHLELTPDMSAPTLIIAMRQFLARKRFPETFIFDNFKSFKFLRNNKIEWKFILDRSTWWGGFY